MKSFSRYILGGFLIFSFAQCGSSQQYAGQDEIPFRFGEIAIENWTRENSKETGINLFFPLENDVDTVIDSVHFRGRIVHPEKIKRGSYVVYVARFMNKQEPGDVIMHADPKKESINQPPVIIKRSPFELSPYEAVVSFMVNGETKYYKVSGIKETTSIVYPDKTKN
ncbi:hypothetical protein MQE36_04870 [Zhouia spongiae]|uniref:Uncharacterized protein n=1 Tax=Zhouia spongiae TaxID=2202721 RepID=A0ABY3YQA9_9FLAO|nr:hypothetical protein [Zhouia spongiae]UNY99681.1 hypothetical protein MQE36_04870 [Zhouia spongiae]